MEKEVTALVSAAACGADLIALTVASDLGLRRRIVLPFKKSRFRETSVADRPGDWGSIFDNVTAEVEAVGDLLILDDVGEDEKAYEATNIAIFDEAKLLSIKTGTPLFAVVVWDGMSRGQGDLTASFANEARLRAILVDEIMTST